MKAEIDIASSRHSEEEVEQSFMLHERVEEDEVNLSSEEYDIKEERSTWTGANDEVHTERRRTTYSPNRTMNTSYYEKSTFISPGSKKRMTTAVVDAMQALQKKLRRVEAEKNSSVKRSARLASLVEIEKKRNRKIEANYLKSVQELSREREEKVEKYHARENRLRKENEQLLKRCSDLDSQLVNQKVEKSRLMDTILRLEKELEEEKAKAKNVSPVKTYESSFTSVNRSILSNEDPQFAAARANEEYVLNLESKILDLELTLERVVAEMKAKTRATSTSESVKRSQSTKEWLGSEKDRKSSSKSKKKVEKKEYEKLDTMNDYLQPPSLHQRLVDANLGKKVPFLLGTNSGESFSVYANAQSVLAEETRGRTVRKSNTSNHSFSQYSMVNPITFQQIQITPSPKSYNRKVEALRTLRRFRKSQN